MSNSERPTHFALKAKDVIHFVDRRNGDRPTECDGVDIEIDGPTPYCLCVELKDIRNDGFYILYPGETLPSGTEFQCRNGPHKVRARMMWSRRIEGRNEGRCVVVPG